MLKSQKLPIFALVLLGVSVFSGCTQDLFLLGGSDAVKLQFLQFNTDPVNWIERRKLLRRVAEDIGRSQPHVLLAQGLRKRSGSPYDSDYAILSELRLSGWSWRVARTPQRVSRFETFSFATVFSPFFSKGLPLEKEKLHQIDEDVYFTSVLVSAPSGPFLVVNLYMSPSDRLYFHAFNQEVMAIAKKEGICPERVVIIGNLLKFSETTFKPHFFSQIEPVGDDLYVFVHPETKVNISRTTQSEAYQSFEAAFIMPKCQAP